MDLSKFDLTKQAEGGHTFKLVHPVEPMVKEGGKMVKNYLDTEITVLGSDSGTYRTSQSKIAEREAKLNREDETRDKYDVERRDYLEAELLSMVTVDWCNLDEDGNPVQCNQENALKVYLKYPWIRQQVAAVVMDRTFFFDDKPKI